MIAVRHRLRKAAAAFFGEAGCYRCRGIGASAKIRRYFSRVLPVLLHGAAGWSITKEVAKLLRAFEGEMPDYRLWYKKERR